MLAAQRDHYLPLRVIREHLHRIDRGLPVPALSSLRTDSGESPATPGDTDGETTGTPPGTPAPKQPMRLTRAELLDASGLTDAALDELERTQIVLPRPGGSHYGRDALTLAIAARRMAEFGIDARHLRAFKMSADREVGLVEQAIAPHIKRASADKDVAGEVTQLVISFHAALVRTAMER